MDGRILSGCWRIFWGTRPETRPSRVIYATKSLAQRIQEESAAANANTHSSSDSSSPLGKLTSSSSSSAFLLREDMVVLGPKQYQLDENALVKGLKRGILAMGRRTAA